MNIKTAYKAKRGLDRADSDSSHLTLFTIESPLKLASREINKKEGMARKEEAENYSLVPAKLKRELRRPTHTWCPYSRRHTFVAFVSRNWCSITCVKVISGMRVPVKGVPHVWIIRPGWVKRASALESKVGRGTEGVRSERKCERKSVARIWSGLHVYLRVYARVDDRGLINASPGSHPPSTQRSSLAIISPSQYS